MLLSLNKGKPITPLVQMSAIGGESGLEMVAFVVWWSKNGNFWPTSSQPSSGRVIEGQMLLSLQKETRSPLQHQTKLRCLFCFTMLTFNDAVLQTWIIILMGLYQVWTHPLTTGTCGTRIVLGLNSPMALHPLQSTTYLSPKHGATLNVFPHGLSVMQMGLFQMAEHLRASPINFILKDCYSPGFNLLKS